MGIPTHASMNCPDLDKEVFMDRPSELVPLRYVAIGGRGPEDVVADAHGRVLTGVEDGRILRIDGLTEPSAARVEVVAETGGRPLGLELLPDDALLVCDAELGLLRVDLAEGIVRILADSVAGERLRFCSNAVALADGSVCFTVSSRRYPLDQWIGDLVEHTGTGRLLRLAPGSERPEVLLEGLQFANGLAAIFIACGQDVANIVNASVGITNFELDQNGDLYASVILPSLTVATVGGGTALGTSRECLEILGCAGCGQAGKFAEIISATLLAGELSMGAAIASGEFVAAHETYGRNRPGLNAL